MLKITYIDENDISHKRVLVRADFDVSLDDSGQIIDDLRIERNVPTIKYLAQNGNKVICIAKLGRPRQRDPKLSLGVVVKRLQELLGTAFTVKLISDFLTEDKNTFDNQKPDEVLVLENIRFYPEEKQNDPEFTKKLALLGDVFVNDSFAMAHRTECSTVGLTTLLPSYGGLSVKNEIEHLEKCVKDPKRPLVVIVGGAKIKDKINFIKKFAHIADFILVGGGLANTFLASSGVNIQESLYEPENLELAQDLLQEAQKNGSKILLPVDGAVNGHSYPVDQIPAGGKILDAGPETMKLYAQVIHTGKTIVWNGPLGLFENPDYRKGTDAVFHAIIENPDARSIIGGGDTLAAISDKTGSEKITHISTGGGAMLEFIEKEGKLPALEVLKK